MDSVKFVLEAPGASVCGGATIPWQCADSLGGASIREGASNRDITVILRCIQVGGDQNRYDVQLTFRRCIVSAVFYHTKIIMHVASANNI